MQNHRTYSTKLRYLVALTLLLGAVAAFVIMGPLSKSGHDGWGSVIGFLGLLFLSALTLVPRKRLAGGQTAEKSRGFPALFAASLIVAAISFVSGTIPCFSGAFIASHFGEQACLWLTATVASGAPVVWIGLTAFAYRNYRAKWRWVLMGWPFVLLLPAVGLLVVGLSELCEYLHPGQCIGF